MIIKRVMLVADTILACLEYLLGPINLDEIVLEPYQCGNEHGWSLKSSSQQKQVSFAEYEVKNPSQAIVYFGAIKEFDSQGNVPAFYTVDIASDMPLGHFVKRKLFKWNETFLAAQFILRFFLDEDNSDPIYVSDTWKEVKTDFGNKQSQN
jgi:hypothetical protein